jgi:hypothetical protein
MSPAVPEQVSLFTLRTFRPFRLQPPLAFPIAAFGFCGVRASPREPAGFLSWPSPLSRGHWRHLGFAFHSQARQGHRPNRVYLRYGRVVRFRLLPTPPHGDAVTFSYEKPNLLSTGTCTPPILNLHRRTSAAIHRRFFFVAEDKMKRKYKAAINRRTPKALTPTEYLPLFRGL